MIACRPFGGTTVTWIGEFLLYNFLLQTPEEEKHCIMFGRGLGLECLEVVSVSQFQSDTTTALTYPTFKSSLPPAPRAGVDSKSLLRIIAEYILSWSLKILINHDMDQLMIRLSGQRLRGIQVKYYLSSDLENYATCFWRPSCRNSINSNYHRLLTREIFLQREKKHNSQSFVTRNLRISSGIGSRWFHGLKKKLNSFAKEKNTE